MSKNRIDYYFMKTIRWTSLLMESTMNVMIITNSPLGPVSLLGLGSADIKARSSPV